MNSWNFLSRPRSIAAVVACQILMPILLCGCAVAQNSDLAFSQQPVAGTQRAVSPVQYQEPAQYQNACDSSFCDSAGRPLDVEFGSRRPVLDTLGWIVGIPDKLLMWDQRAKNHRVSPDTVREVGDYLSYADIGDVKIRANQYDPIGEWQRLVNNDRVGAGWKYTAGLMRHVRYTLMPGRLFGRDEYNPYTNSLSMYSDMPSLGLAESAYAYDVRQRAYPGTYATVQTLPLVSMWHETLATGEVLNYIAIRGNPQEQRKIRRDLYARYGVSVGGEIGSYLPNGSSLYEVAGAVVGHTTAALEDRQQLLR